MTNNINNNNNIYDDVINLQPTINIGVIGSVSNGKSTLTEKITGIKTQRHSEELQRNITVKLGYANAKIYRCDNCSKPECYQSYSSNTMKATCKICSTEMKLIRHISFVDCPGHNVLLATMMNGTCIMDTTIIVEAVNNDIVPSSQTKEHIIATSIKQIPTAFVCLNKVDVARKNITVSKINEISAYLSTSNINCPIVPISAGKKLNLDVVCEYLCTKVVEPKRDLVSSAKMIIIRSFNVNKPNCTFVDLCGGVVGGSIVRGVFEVGDKVKILPGLSIKNGDSFKYKPILSVIESINSEKNNLIRAIPGGLIGVRLDIDPSLTVHDNMVGQILIKQDDEKDYAVLEEIAIRLNPVNDNYKELKKGDAVKINYNGTNINATILNVRDTALKLKLDKIICLEINDLITVSKATKNGINNENLCGVIFGSAKLLNGKTNNKIVDIYEGVI